MTGLLIGAAARQYNSLWWTSCAHGVGLSVRFSIPLANKFQPVYHVGIASYMKFSVTCG